MWSVCRRRRDSSTARRTFSAESPRSFFPWAHLAEHLGREHDLLATAAEASQSADGLLGPAATIRAAVAVGRVEEGHALIEGVVHDREGILLRGVGAEVHGAEDEPGDGRSGASELGVLHRDELLVSWRPPRQEPGSAAGKRTSAGVP